jgi:Ca2+-binding EF-hand superfamily protein
MKLAVLAFILGAAGIASADPVPAGPMPAPMVAPGPRGPLQQALLERFDKNHDGRLEPNERRHAIKALRRLTRRMIKQERRAERQIARERGVIRRYDTNHDGVVGPDEMPPGLAKRMRHLDRNGDGWLDDADQ